MCAIGTLTCGEMGIGPKSQLLLAAFRICESAVVEEALLLLYVVWYADEDDSEGEMALVPLLLLWKSVMPPPLDAADGAAAGKYIFGLDG